MDKTEKIIFAIVSGLVIVGGVVIYYFTTKTPPKKTPPPGTTPKTVAPQATSTTGFPISQGATGALVTNLQNGLNQYVGINITVDGNFGSLTAGALNTLGFSIPVSLSDYNTIIAPPDASNSVQVATPFDVTTGALPQTMNDAEQVELDPNATSAQQAAANAIINGQQAQQAYGI